MSTVDMSKYFEIFKELENSSVGEKNLRMAGVISDYVKKKHGFDIIIVGGLSVEYYTDGGYITENIDIVGEERHKVLSCMKDLGFKQDGKDAVLEWLKIYAEVPDEELKNADYRKVINVKTVDGFNLRFIGIDDIFWDRIRARVDWHEGMQDTWLMKLYEHQKQDMDLDYIKGELTPKELIYFEDLMSVIEEDGSNLSKHNQLKFFLKIIITPLRMNKGCITLKLRKVFYHLQLGLIKVDLVII